MKQINWKFPQTKDNNLLPWYVMLKNLPALPFILLALVFGCAYVTCMSIGYLIAKGPTFACNYVSDQFNNFDLR
jgi:hypothetical protein